MSEPEIQAKVHPAIQFVLLIIPVVMTGFFLVYSLTGAILDGRDLFNWSLEARAVALRVGAGIVIYSLFVMLYARWKGLAKYHMLMVSGAVHLILALILTAFVYIIVSLPS